MTPSYIDIGRAYPCDAKHCPALRESAIGPLPCEGCVPLTPALSVPKGYPGRGDLAGGDA